MKTIGLIGGMSWQSTESYYRLINTAVKTRLGGFHSSKVLINSLDFAEIESLQSKQDWSSMATILIKAAEQLQSAGADCLLIATNTMHKVAEQVEQACKLPLLHIADATALELKRQKISSIGLIGTAFTMEQAFYKERLRDKHGINVVIPNAQQRQLIHQVIYQELCQGVTLETSRQAYLEIISALAEQGAEGVILGCTEIGLLIKQADTQVALFDTTHIHAEYAVNYQLS